MCSLELIPEFASHYYCERAAQRQGSSRAGFISDPVHPLDSVSIIFLLTARRSALQEVLTELDNLRKQELQS